MSKEASEGLILCGLPGPRGVVASALPDAVDQPLQGPVRGRAQDHRAGPGIRCASGALPGRDPEVALRRLAAHRPHGLPDTAKRSAHRQLGGLSPT